MQKPRIKKLRATGSGVVYQCKGRLFSGNGSIERYGYGHSLRAAYESWHHTGINASVSFK